MSLTMMERRLEVLQNHLMSPICGSNSGDWKEMGHEHRGQRSPIRHLQERMSGAKLTKGKARARPDPSQLGLSLLRVYIIDLTGPGGGSMLRSPINERALSTLKKSPLEVGCGGFEGKTTTRLLKDLGI